MSRGGGGICQNMILYYTGGGGASQNMILYYAMWGEGGGGKSKYDFVLCNVRGGGGTNLILLDTWGG